MLILFELDGLLNVRKVMYLQRQYKELAGGKRCYFGNFFGVVYVQYNDGACRRRRAMFCNACGTELQPTFHVCPKCGKPLEP